MSKITIYRGYCCKLHVESYLTVMYNCHTNIIVFVDSLIPQPAASVS